MQLPKLNRSSRPEVISAGAVRGLDIIKNNLAVIGKSRLLLLSIACAALTGCDEIKNVEAKQADVEKRVLQIEEQLTVVKSELNKLTEGRKHSSQSFNSCVYENMRGVASDLAARSIKVACLKKFSIEISKDNWTKRSDAGAIIMLFTASATHQVTGDSKSTGFWVTLKNNMEYIITEITVEISIKGGPFQSYRTDDFYEDLPRDPRVIVTGPPLDPTVRMRVDPFKEITYFIKTNDAAQIGQDSKFQWDIVSMKGIPTK